MLLDSVMFADALTFAAPLWLWTLLVAVPLALALFVRAERETARRLARLVAAPRLRARLAPTISPARRRWRFALELLALVALLVALARPRWGFEEQTVKRRGLDLLVLVDVSKSMLATDLAPNRLGRERLAVLDLLNVLPGDRVGLVAFAGGAFLQAPLTIDYDAVRSAVAELDTELIPRGGTDIAAAIDLALEAFGQGESGHRAIVLFTDGEELEADALKAARRAADASVPVFTVGLGSAEGSVIPLPSDRRQLGGSDFVRDAEGKVVRSRLDEKRLREIAAITDGSYVRLQSGEPEMKTLAQNQLARLATGDIDARLSRRPIERYAWPLGGALLALGASALVGERRPQRARAAVPATTAPIRVLPPQQAATAALLFLLCGLVVFNPLPAAFAASTADAETALELYNQGKYDDAYRAYEDLLKANPGSGKLHFNAGAAAFQRKDYDGALAAFGKALGSADEPGLQASAQYNLGNTLFRHGEEQKDPEARIKDWKNALDYYNATIKATDQDPQRAAHLRTDAEHNRDLVKKKLAEEQKKQQQQQSQQNQQQSSSSQKSSGGKQGQDRKQSSKPDPSKSGSERNRSEQEQKNSPSNGGQQPPQSQAQEGQNGDNGDPQQNDPNGRDPGARGQRPSDRPPEGGNGGNEQKPGAQGSKPDDRSQQQQQQRDGDKDQASRGQENADSATGKNNPRQRGDVQAQRGQASKNPDKPTDGSSRLGEGETADNGANAADGRMSAAQARALLDALRNEDDRNATAALQARGSKKKRDDPSYQDW